MRTKKIYVCESSIIDSQIIKTYYSNLSLLCEHNSLSYRSVYDKVKKQGKPYTKNGYTVYMEQMITKLE